MAQLVLISARSIRDGLSVIGDVVSVHNDKDTLTGPGYECFTIIKVPGTVDEVQFLLDAGKPEITYRAGNPVAWKDGLVWRKIETYPKHQHKIVVDKTLLDNLESAILTTSQKRALLIAAQKVNIKELPENQATTVIG